MNLTDSKWDSHGRMAIRGAVAGLVAGVIFGALQMWFLADAGLPANTIIHMIATIVQPDEYFAAGETSLAVGWAVHIGLSIGYGTLFGLLCAELSSNITRVWMSAVYGLAIYMFNFLVLAPFFYPVFEENANQPFEGTVHVVYGALLSPFLVKWSGRSKNAPTMAPVVAQAERNQGVEVAPGTPLTRFEPTNLR